MNEKSGMLWMRVMLAWLFAAPLWGLAAPAGPSSSTVTLYPFPKDLPASAAFHLKVAGQDVFVHKAEVADFAAFAISGAVEVAVECDAPVTKAVVRPLSRKITPKCEGNAVRFTVDQPGPLTLEINSKIKPALHLFIDPSETNAPQPGSPGVRRLAGGKVHEAGEITLKDGETLYLEPGAVVRGVVRAKGARNIRIQGRGIFDARERTTKAKFMSFEDCAGVTLSDVIVLGSYGWTLVPTHCQDVRLDNVKVFSWRDNDDGLDICASRRVVVDRCFFRTKDDCIAVKALKSDRTGQYDVDTVLVRNSVFWNAEWGNALEIGFELRTPGVRNISWTNCDIIRVEKGSVFSIHNGDFAAVENVLFDNIRVEDADDMLVDLRVGLSVYSDATPERYHRRNPKRQPTGNGPWVPAKLLSEAEKAAAAKNAGAIRAVRFRNIQLLEKIPPQSFILNDGGKIGNIWFENIRHGDKKLERLEDLNLKVDGATGVRLKP